VTEPGKAGKVRESGGWSQSQIHFCLRCRLPGIKPVWWRCGIVNWSRLLKPKTGHQIFWCYILTSEFLCSNDLKCLLMLHWRHKLVGCQWCCSERSRQWGCTVLTELTKVSPLVCNLFVIGLGYTSYFVWLVTTCAMAALRSFWKQHCKLQHWLWHLWIEVWVYSVQALRVESRPSLHWLWYHGSHESFC